MTKVIISNTMKISTNLISRFALIFVAMICLLLYVYFANSAVRTVTLLEKTKEEIQNISVNVSDLESQRLMAENNVTFEKAKTLGFVKIDNQSFILNKPTKTAFSGIIE